MAFDHADTDSVFRRMKDTLGRINIDLTRVDRIEHNDDLDDRIISEIEKADFVIADLTYARPPVYFEAGYAQRCAPVVYTARSDHFQAKVDDLSGNLRVHFDLQMKNIIAWSDPNDARFFERSKARASRVIAPLLARKRADSEAKQKAAEFDRMALQERLEFLRKVARGHFRRLQYRITDLTFEEHNAPEFLNRYASGNFWGAVAAM